MICFPEAGTQNQLLIATLAKDKSWHILFAMGRKRKFPLLPSVRVRAGQEGEQQSHHSRAGNCIILAGLIQCQSRKQKKVNLETSLFGPILAEDKIGMQQ